MEDHELSIDLGMLCRCCNYDSYELPEIEGLTPSQRRYIEDVCKLCVESFRLAAVNG